MFWLHFCSSGQKESPGAGRGSGPSEGSGQGAASAQATEGKGEGWRGLGSRRWWGAGRWGRWAKMCCFGGCCVAEVFVWVSFGFGLLFFGRRLLGLFCLLLVVHVWV